MYSVSVIMPVYNNEETLKQAIDAILKQTIYDLELILINDGSTDASAQICEEYVKKEPLLVEAIHQEKSSFGQARNKGLLHSSGKYIYFANATDIVQDKLLEDNFKLAEEKAAELIVFGFSECNDKYLNGKLEHFPRLPELPTQIDFRQHYRNFHQFYPYILHNKLYRRDYLKKHRIRFKKDSFRADASFNLRVYKELNSVVFNRMSYCEYYNQDEMNGKDLYKMNLDVATSFEMMMKHWSYETEFQDLIIREYYHVIYAEIQNMSADASGLNTDEQEERLNSILTDERVRAVLDNFEPKNEKNPHMKAVMYALKKLNGKAAIQLVTSKKDTEKTKSKITQLFRKLFN